MQGNIQKGIEGTATQIKRSHQCAYHGGKSVLDRENSKGKSWEVGMSLACSLRFPCCWSPESEEKSGRGWMGKVREGQIVKGL